MTQQEHYILGKAHIEGTQRGYVIWVKTNKRNKAQLTDATSSYDDARATAESINRGRWVGRRKGHILRIYGRKLTVH